MHAKYEKQINTKKKKTKITHRKRCNRCQITQIKPQMSPKTGGQLLVRVEDATVFRQRGHDTPHPPHIHQKWLLNAQDVECHNFVISPFYALFYSFFPRQVKVYTRSDIEGSAATLSHGLNNSTKSLYMQMRMSRSTFLQ